MDEYIGRGRKADSKCLQMVMTVRNKSRFATGPKKISEIRYLVLSWKKEYIAELKTGKLVRHFYNKKLELLFLFPFPMLM